MHVYYVLSYEYKNMQNYQVLNTGKVFDVELEHLNLMLLEFSCLFE